MAGQWWERPMLCHGVCTKHVYLFHLVTRFDGRAVIEVCVQSMFICFIWWQGLIAGQWWMRNVSCHSTVWNKKRLYTSFLVTQPDSRPVRTVSCQLPRHCAQRTSTHHILRHSLMVGRWGLSHVIALCRKNMYTSHLATQLDGRLVRIVSCHIALCRKTPSSRLLRHGLTVGRWGLSRPHLNSRCGLMVGRRGLSCVGVCRMNVYTPHLATRLEGRSVVIGGLCRVIARVESTFDAYDLVTQFDGRSQLQFQMLLHDGQSQQEQRLAVDLLHTQGEDSSRAGRDPIRNEQAQTRIHTSTWPWNNDIFQVHSWGFVHVLGGLFLQATYFWSIYTLFLTQKNKN